MSMVDLYEIGISFLIERNIFSDVETLEKGMGTLQEAIDKVNASLASTADLLGAVRGAAGGMAASFEAAAAAAERMFAAADRMDGMGGRVPGEPGGASVPLLQAPNEPGGTLPRYADSGTPGVPALIPGQPYYSGDDGATFRRSDYVPNFVPSQPGGEGEQYPPAPVIPPGGQTSGGHISSWDYMIAGGLAYEGGKSFVTSAYDQAADVQHQAFLIQNQGATSATAQQAVSAAQSLQQQYPGLTQGQAMTIIRDAYMQTRNMPEAIGMANNLAQAAYVMQGFGDTDAAEAMFSLSRSGELRGLLNEKNPDGSVKLDGFESFINSYTKAAISTGGRVSPNDALTILKNAGPEGLMMNQDAMTDSLILSTTMGASGVGTGINALAMQFLGGKMSQGAAQNLHRAGLLPDYMFDENGKILNKYKNGIGQVLLPDGALENETQFQHNPFDWVEHTFDPAISKLDPGSQTAILNSIYADISRIPGGRLAAETIFQQGFLQRQLGFLNGVPDVGTAANNLKNDPQNVAGGFSAAFNAFMAQLGSDAMPQATTALKDLTGALNGLTDWSKHHPHEGAAAVDAGLGAAGILAAGGAAAGGMWLYDTYAKLFRRLGFGGGKGSAGDASFADADGTAAGEGAIPLGEAAGGAAASTGIGALVPLIVPAVLAYMMTHKDPFPNAPDDLHRYGIRGQPIPVTIVPAQGGAALPVLVANPHEIANGSLGALAYHQGLMPTGPNGINSALVPHNPGTDAPGAFMP